MPLRTPTIVLLSAVAVLAIGGFVYSQKKRAEYQRALPTNMAVQQSAQSTSEYAVLPELPRIPSNRTDQLSYSLKGVPATVSQFSTPFGFTAQYLQEKAEECGASHPEGHFDQVVQAFQDTQRMVYEFTYQGESQDSGTYTVTVLPNAMQYFSLEEFKKDFEACHIAGDMYPHAVNAKWLLFVSSSTSGVDDESGRPHGGHEVKKAVEPTLKLK